MAGSKSTQTRFVRHISICYTSLRLLFLIIMHLLMLMYLSSAAYGRHSGYSLVVTMVQDSCFLIQLHYFCTPQKARVGMYSRCLCLTNLVCVLFDPAIPTSSFNFILVILLPYTVRQGNRRSGWEVLISLLVLRNFLLSSVSTLEQELHVDAMAVYDKAPATKFDASSGSSSLY